MLTIFLVTLFGALLLGAPVAFALILSTIALMVFNNSFDTQIVVQHMMAGAENYTLMAIPFFMLAGEIMNHGGISTRIIKFASDLVGHVKGGLGYVTVIACMIFAGVSGTAVADTAAVGSILHPVMKREGYDSKRSAALICAAGCTGPIIPPSVPMILYGVIGGVSIVGLFLGGIVPGLIMGIALMIYWYLHTRKTNYPIKPRVSFATLLRSTIDAAWALVLPFIILGGIVFGVFTPTEAAVIAVFYAFFVSFVIYRELELSKLPKILLDAAINSAVVMFVAAAATSTGFMITVGRIPQSIAETILSISSDPAIVMLIINFFLLLVGTVMDLTPALLILAPILISLTKNLGIDPLYFGVVMVFNLCIGLLTPPVGTVLFVGCGLSGHSITELSRRVLPLVLVLIAVLFLITYVPETIMTIPKWYQGLRTT
ncbi:TRAP dicarboxylate transporter, DctM subunit [Thermosinus carboxydivorans Nor1]|uniref:TRAP dicarboxylate transporter, DctM subunit n=1 Tax=Thermosinus carboxydivorans Nor1 TaxID=401526 RepID=A1HSQ2_9FIRM|nr:TRAP transporter large permease [Thermosinus carboxydivorans]EAX46933.1 TRAP dicarboxylate transporter, DctM subunit [Thermosinus carboxydivorans Nor1]